MGRIKDLPQYSGSIQRQDVWFMADGDSFSRGMKMSAQQIYTLTKGSDGRNIEIQNSGTYIQWRLVGDASWANLVQLSTLKGADGKELEVRVSGGYIQTRLTGGAWANLVAVADLKGEKGDNAPSPNLTFQISALEAGEAATASVTGTYPNLTVSLGIPRGQNAALPNLSFQISALAADAEATASVVGTYPNLTLQLGIPRGRNASEPVFTVMAESKTAGTNPEVAVTGTYPNLALTFKIPAGATGPEGRGPVVLASGNYGNWDAGLSQYVDSGVPAVAAVSEASVTFTQAEVRANVATGESLKVLFGKVRKWFADMGALAFKNKVSWSTDIDDKPTGLSEFSNDTGYITDSAVTEHNQDASAHEDIRGAIADGVKEAKDYADEQIAEIDLSGYEDKTNRVAINSQATEEQYPTAKSVWDLVQDVIATIPAGGLKVPLSKNLESALPNVTTLTPGDYFYIQDMDVSAPGHSGRAWVNYTDPGDTTTPLMYYKVIDQYFSADGESIVQTGGGALQVSTAWLNEVISNAMTGYVPSSRTIAGLDLSADRTADALKTALGLTNDFDNTYKTLLDFLKTTRTVTSLSSLAMATCQTVYASISSDQTLSCSGTPPVGQVVHVFVKNAGTTNRTIVIPTTGSYISMSGASATLPASGYLEINIAYDTSDSKYKIVVIEKA
jgi:hypothetical protein